MGNRVRMAHRQRAGLGWTMGLGRELGLGLDRELGFGFNVFSQGYGLVTVWSPRARHTRTRVRVRVRVRVRFGLRVHDIQELVIQRIRLLSRPDGTR